MFNFSQIPHKRFLQHIKSIIEIRKKTQKNNMKITLTWKTEKITQVWF